MNGCCKIRIEKKPQLAFLVGNDGSVNERETDFRHSRPMWQAVFGDRGNATGAMDAASDPLSRRSGRSVTEGKSILMVTSAKTRKPAAKPVAMLLASLALSTLAACSAVPNDGPTAKQVLDSAVPVSAVKIDKSKLAFDVVDVDQRIANNVTQLGQPSLVRTFGFGGAPGMPVIGVGDKLVVTIFEAGPDGLFSTAEHKQTPVPVLVQPDGYGQIPYIGRVRFAGQTLDQAREQVSSALKSKAVEPDVIIEMEKSNSRTVSVLGVVGRPQVVPLDLGPEPLSKIIAMAGGPTRAPFDTYVTLTRGKKTERVLLQSILDNPKDDINVRAGDKIYLTYDPRTFSVLGAAMRPANLPIDVGSLSLVEAAARVGGANNLMSDPRGFFIFRFEYEAVYRQVVGEDRFRELLSKGMMANKEGMYPIVYRFDMSDPQTFIVAQSFPIRDKDLLYISHHPTVDWTKFSAVVTRQLDMGYKAVKIEQSF